MAAPPVILALARRTTFSAVSVSARSVSSHSTPSSSSRACISRWVGRRPAPSQPCAWGLATTAPASYASFPTHPSKPQLQLVLQRRHLSSEVRRAIEAAVSSAPVVLFMKGTPELPACGYSRATLQVLGMSGVDPAKFHAFNVLDDAQLRAGIKEFSDWPTIPQLYVSGEFVGGCDIVMDMYRNGELVKLLMDKNVVLLEDSAQQDSEAGAANAPEDAADAVSAEKALGAGKGAAAAVAKPMDEDAQADKRDGGALTSVQQQLQKQQQSKL